jgi:hypothetical protein
VKRRDGFNHEPGWKKGDKQWLIRIKKRSIRMQIRHIHKERERKRD